MTELDLIKDIKERFQDAHNAWNMNFQEAIDDLNFCFTIGAQWPANIKAERIRDGRPCFEINKLPYYVDQVIGDIRQNEPSVKIKPIDSVADPKTAEILGGLIKSIEAFSDAEVAYDTAAETAIVCGFGAWRVVTRFAMEDTFDQDIFIERIKNPFTIWWGPAEHWDKSDAEYCFITERIAKYKYQKDYPDATLMAFESSKDKGSVWGSDKEIRIVEYFTREKVNKKLFLMQDAQGKMYTTFEKPDNAILEPLGWKIVKERDSETYEVKWCKANQSEILEKQTVWPGKYIPIIMVYEKENTIEGKTTYRGMIKYGKDPQRLYNMSRSTSVELVSLAPKSPYLVTAQMIKNYQPMWDQAHKKNYPYLMYEVDKDNAAAIPQRATPVSANTGISEQIMISDNEMHDTIGLQKSNLGQKSNESSGRAILARQREGDTAQYPYYDNLGRAMKYNGKVLLDLIPKIYDTARIVRILGDDNQEKLVPVNQNFPDRGDNGESISRIYDLTVGKYDVTVSIGPSFATQREEAAASMMDFIGAVPQAGSILGDLLAKNLNWPGAQEIEKRLKTLLPPQVQAVLNNQPVQQPIPEVLKMRGEAARVMGNELANEEKFNRVMKQKQERVIPNPEEEV